MDPHFSLGSDTIINAFSNCSENFGFSPREIVAGLSTDYVRDCKVDVGSYVEASTAVPLTNNNTERTRSCVTLGRVDKAGLSQMF